MVLPFLGVYMTDHLHFSIEDAGIVLAFYGVGSVLGSFIGGYFTDRYGEYKVQLLSLFLSVPLFLLIPVFPTFHGLMIIILLQSTVTETFRPANSVAITKYARAGNITRSFSLNRMAINLGFSIGPAMGGILSAISYEFLFITNAVAVLAAGIAYVIFFRRRNKIFDLKMKRAEKQASQGENIVERNAYRDVPFLVYSLLCMVFSVCFFQFFSTIPIFYKDVAHLDQQTIGYVLGYSGFLLVILEMLVVNWAEKALSLPKTLLVGAFFVALSFLFLWLDTSLLVIVISITALSLAEILALPFMSTITALRAGKKNSGAYMGLNGMSFALSFIITPLLGTWIAAEYGFNMLWILSIITVGGAGVGLYFIVRKMLAVK